MAEVAEREQAAVLAVQDVPREKTGSYGIVDAKKIDERSSLVRHLVEKPSPDDAPSTLGVVGRYVLPGRILTCWPPPGRARVARSSSRTPSKA